MSGIQAVNSGSVAQVQTPQEFARASETQPSVQFSSQLIQEDTLTISSQGLQALEDALGLLSGSGKQHHRQGVADLFQLTYSNYQLTGNQGVAAQAAQVSGLGSAESAGTAKA